MLETSEVLNPFPGLRPFETEETNLFFGRDGQSDQLLARLRLTRFLAVVGTSGSGKSSLIRAGLLPALYGGLMGGAGSNWRIAIMRPGSDPIGNLACALSESGIFTGSKQDGEIQNALTETTLRRSWLGLVDATRQARMAPQENLLIVVDQFEELFRFKEVRKATESENDAASFVNLLLEASAQTELPIYVVLTMRSDFLGDCAQFMGLPEAINKGQYLIPRMSRDERRAAITGPVAVAGAAITLPLVSRVLNDVGDNPDQLPIMQHALMRTWDYRAAHSRNGDPVGLNDYEAIGTMSEALSRHADEAYGELSNERSQKIAERMFKRLTEKGADNREIRRPTRLAEICAVAEAGQDEVIAVINVFRKPGRSFLMPPMNVELNGDTVIDISHESLIRNWQKLQTWVDEEALSARIYRRLAEAAALHSEGSEALLQNPGLQIDREWFEKNKPNAAWAQRYHPEFEQAIAYLNQSHAAREAELAEEERRRNQELERARHEREQAEQFAAAQARSAKRLRRVVAVTAVLAVIAGGAAITAGLLWNQASSSAAAARKAQDEAIADKKTADEAKENAQASAIIADVKTFQLDAERQYAESQKQAAEAAKKKALAAEANAEQQRAKAVIAQRKAESNAKQFAEALDRGRDMREGLEAYQSEDMEIAYHSFSNLVQDLQSALGPQGNQLAPDKRRDLKVDLGWAQSNLGNVQLNTGNLEDAKDSYEQSRQTLEEIWPKQQRDTLPPEDILFSTYNGLGNAYRDIALVGAYYKQGGKQAINPDEYFNHAKELFLDSLNFHKSRLQASESGSQLEARASRRGIATGYQNLARLYSEMGLPKEAEQNLKELAAFQTKEGDQEANIAAQKALAEFYRNLTLDRVETETGDLKKNLENARVAYDKLLGLQEDIKNIEDYAKVPPEIASGYTELSFIYRGLADLSSDEANNARAEAARLRQTGDDSGEKEKLKVASARDQDARDATDKANAATQAITAVQTLSRRFRSTSATAATTSSRGDDRDDLAEAVGNIYLRLNQFDKASKLFEFALDVRRKSTVPVDHDLVWKSLSTLVTVYRKRIKDPQAAEHAEKYSKELVELSRQQKPNSGTYADALMQLASLYVDLYPTDQAKTSQAEALYREAHGIYAKRGDWWNEDLVLFRLSKLYEKQKPLPTANIAAGRSPREQALNDRVEVLSKYFNKLANHEPIQPNDPTTLVSEYLYAINALAYFYDGKNPAGAETAYAHAAAAYDYVTQSIYNDKVLGFYADTLKDYGQLLAKSNKPAEAVQISEKEKQARDKLQRLNQIRAQQSVQQVSQGQARQ